MVSRYGRSGRNQWISNTYITWRIDMKHAQCRSDEQEEEVPGGLTVPITSTIHLIL